MTDENKKAADSGADGSLWFLEGVSDHDWPEDFHLENGCYNCRCLGCGVIFTGYKRRVYCKVCAGGGFSLGETL